jgi:hypothetical protein
LSTRQDLQRIIEWCDTNPPLGWLKAVAGVAMEVHPVENPPNPRNRALLTGDLALHSAGIPLSEFPDEPVRFEGTLTGVRNPARQPKLVIKADTDRIVATLSGGQIPAAWSADFEIHQIRDEAGLISAAWEFRPDAADASPAEPGVLMRFELLIWPAFRKNIDLGPP